MPNLSWGFGEGAVVGDWPRNDAGEPIVPAFLKHVADTRGELNILRPMLASFGVPTVCRYPGDGQLGEIVLGFSGSGVDVYVPETMLEDALNIINTDNIEVIEEEN